MAASATRLEVDMIRRTIDLTSCRHQLVARCVVGQLLTSMHAAETDGVQCQTVRTLDRTGLTDVAINANSWTMPQ